MLTAECAGFIEDEKPSWDAVAIHPPYVLGEVIHQCDKPESLNTSVGKCKFIPSDRVLTDFFIASFWSWPAGEKTEKDIPGPIGNWVDVKESQLFPLLSPKTCV